jgi:nuclear pore complex protein Nup133
MVWPYALNTSSPETFTFALPYPSRHVSDPLPLGALVAPSAASEDPGLLVVMPTTGKISYWESISSAATLDFLRQQRNGVEDAVPGMSSGEHVLQLVNAETAGFILALSSGRLAYLNVRDSHGKPAITVQYLRGGLGPNPTGFFGSIRHALKVSVGRGDIAAVRARPPTRVGERTIALATCKGKVKVWRIHRGGNHEALVDVDVREDILHAIRQIDPSVDAALSETLEVFDLTFLPAGVDERYRDMSRLSNLDGNENTHQVVLLVSITGKRSQPYFLVELVASPQGSWVGMTRPITSYSRPVNASALARPRVYLPSPALMAYVVFDRAVVVASIAQPPDTPDSQLRQDSHVLPAAFEDVIDLRSDVLEIVGSGVEELPTPSQELEISKQHRQKTKNPAVVLVVRGVGLIRVAVTDIERFGSERPPELTAKSKLEQAVFFGIKDDNPVVFEAGGMQQFSSKEIGKAAVQLSNEILSSRTNFIPNVPASLEHNLRTRCNYLDRLMSHLKALKVDLDRNVRWTLLWNAEKMAAAVDLWLLHEQFLESRGDAQDGEKKSLVSEVVEYIHEDDKKNPDRKIGEVDAVRHFFINDVWRLEIFVPWAYEVIKYIYKQHLLNESGITRLLQEATEMNIRALRGAWDYRTKKASFYGLDPNDLEWGVLKFGYEGLAEPWTSTFFVTNNAKRLAELCAQWLDRYYPPNTTENPEIDAGLIESIRANIPTLTDCYLVALQEHSRWAETRSDPKELEFGARCAKSYEEDRYHKVCRLKDYGLWDEALEVAARHKSTRAMAEIMVEEVRTRRKESTSRDVGGVKAAEMRRLANEREQQIGEWFHQFDDGFAFAVFDILLRDEGIKAVLDFSADKDGKYITKYLRSRPDLAKISWIHDVAREEDVAHAADTLLSLGLSEQEKEGLSTDARVDETMADIPAEQQVWNKKIELSLAALALRVEKTPWGKGRDRQGSVDDPSVSLGAKLSRAFDALTLVDFQRRLYDAIFPGIRSALDETAEIALAVDTHKLGKKTAPQFEEGMKRLIRHEALDAAGLIDMLTLGNYERLPVGTLFAMALIVVEKTFMNERRREMLQMVWRRCYTRNDWKQVNDGQAAQQDTELTEALLDTAAYATVWTLRKLRKCFEQSLLYHSPD